MTVGLSEVSLWMWAIGLCSVVLGIAYLGLGVLGASEVAMERKTLGVSRFGLAFAFMAASCGPHHLLHGKHVLAGMDADAAVAVITILGMPAGLVFVLLRVEAFAGGRGDRFISGTPTWLMIAPGVFLTAVGMIVGGSLALGDRTVDLVSPLVLSNLYVTVTYSLVAWPLVRTQLRRHHETGGWSLSGLALSGIFPTCASAHLVYALRADGDWHMTVVGLIGVPASIYFLWVVRALYRNSIVDWNRRPVVGASRPAQRPSPWVGSR